MLFDVSACVYNTPTHFFVYNASSNTLTQIPDVPNAPNDSSYYTRMLALPNGQVLFNDGSRADAGLHGRRDAEPVLGAFDHIAEFHHACPGQAATPCPASSSPGWTRAPPTVTTSRTTPTSPLVRITNSATGVVTYARTSNWTSVSVAPGTAPSTKFTLPPGTPAGQEHAGRGRQRDRLTALDGVGLLRPGGAAVPRERSG